MADTKREIERKYEVTDDTRLPDLTRAAGVDRSVHRGLTELDAVYHDTADLRLAADALTLRRRTGGADEGWHLKFPVAVGIRDELHEPLSDDLPRPLAALLRSRVRHAEIAPVVRLRSARDVHHLLAGDGTLLAEVSVDRVHAERLTGEGRGTTAAWTEIEVELADDGDPAVLDAVEKRLRKAGIRPAQSSSKLARALGETTPARNGEKPEKDTPRTAGDHVLAYVRKQIRAIVDLDPAVRRDLPDSVHKMRVATRRLRSTFKTHRRILDREVTDPLGAELKWLAAELGLDRDQEVLDERIGSRVEAPARDPHPRSRARPAPRLVGRPPHRIAPQDHRRTRRAALSRPPGGPRRAGRRPAPAPRRRQGTGQGPAPGRPQGLRETRAPDGPCPGAPAGPERDTAMHEARKAAKRARYAGESARPALGRPAKRFAKRVKAVQSVLGDHQDSVVAREALRALAIEAHAAGETAFTWGLLYGQEEAAAEARERELPEVWARASDPALRADLKH
ncbi:CHAD domain-containing protein [Streptomyces sp. Termitarium-T10T-6]|nr:CHAD domain-containing protein [Streptomyces sp. Termitarium-T10T-6]